MHWYVNLAYLSPTWLYQINYVFANFVLYFAYKRFDTLGHLVRIFLPSHNFKLTQVMMQDKIHSFFKVPFVNSFIKSKTLLCLLISSVWKNSLGIFKCMALVIYNENGRCFFFLVTHLKWLHLPQKKEL